MQNVLTCVRHRRPIAIDTRARVSPKVYTEPEKRKQLRNGYRLRRGYYIIHICICICLYISSAHIRSTCTQQHSTQSCYSDMVLLTHGRPRARARAERLADACFTADVAEICKINIIWRCAVAVAVAVSVSARMTLTLTFLGEEHTGESGLRCMCVCLGGRDLAAHNGGGRDDEHGRLCVRPRRHVHDDDDVVVALRMMPTGNCDV